MSADILSVYIYSLFYFIRFLLPGVVHTCTWHQCTTATCFSGNTKGVLTRQLCINHVRVAPCLNHTESQQLEAALYVTVHLSRRSVQAVVCKHTTQYGCSNDQTVSTITLQVHILFSVRCLPFTSLCYGIGYCNLAPLHPTLTNVLPVIYNETQQPVGIAQFGTEPCSNWKQCHHVGL